MVWKWYRWLLMVMDGMYGIDMEMKMVWYRYGVVWRWYSDAMMMLWIWHGWYGYLQMVMDGYGGVWMVW